jgi:uncharacterized membrane protein YphA (DoxX/SURF4 family)
LSDSELLYLLARILTCGIWIAAALYKATHFERTVHEMREHGIPLAREILPLVLLLEIGGSLLLILDITVWFVAMVRNGTIDFVHWILFWKIVSIAGGLIALILLDASRPGWLAG